jgi:hypothetical protein
MKAFFLRIVGILAVVVVSFMPARALGAADAPPAVSLESLLEEMRDRNAAARLPEPAFILKQAGREAVEKTSQALLHVASSPPPAGAMKQARLAPGEELSLDLPRGAAAVRDLRVQIDPKETPQALRSMVLQASFDGVPTVWCPIGEFFGAGVRLHPVEDWWRTVAADGKLVSRWVMPYQRRGRLSLKNAGVVPVAVTLAATTALWPWNDRSLHFHANWHCQLDMKTRPMSDWNYINVQGQGRYAGDTLSVFSPVEAWYGEGDERIYYDGAKFPAHIGTGTEDYYGYAWGMAGYFSSPFISMPQRDSRSQSDWRGCTTTSRLRLLDGIPFQTALKQDMEIWNWADTQVDYAELLGRLLGQNPGITCPSICLPPGYAPESLFASGPRWGGRTHRAVCVVNGER